MSEWLVKLQGNIGDLGELCSIFTSSELSVIKLGDDYFIRSSIFAGLPDAEKVREQGGGLLNCLNGIALLCVDRSLVISEAGVVRVDDDGRLNQYIFVDLEAILTPLRSSVYSVLPDGSIRPAFSPYKQFDVSTWIVRARQEKSVSDAFAYFRQNDWDGLYKTFEVISADVGGRSALLNTGWTNKSELRRFTGTANHPDAIGTSARHARSNEKPPDNPMSSKEGRAFVKKLLIAWMQSKL